MITELALDLKVARRKSGLRMRDVAHLLGIHSSTLSKIEKGAVLPNAQIIATLSLVYNRSLGGLLASLLREAHEKLPERLAILPECSTRWRGTFNRQQTLNRLAAHLETITADHDTA